MSPRGLSRPLAYDSGASRPFRAMAGPSTVGMIVIAAAKKGTE